MFGKNELYSEIYKNFMEILLFNWSISWSLTPTSESSFASLNTHAHHVGQALTKVVWYRFLLTAVGVVIAKIIYCIVKNKIIPVEEEEMFLC